MKFFAAEVGPARASVVDAIQRPLIMNALKDPTGKPSGKTLPLWYMVARNDQAITSEVERMFAKGMGGTVVEIGPAMFHDLSSGGLLSPISERSNVSQILLWGHSLKTTNSSGSSSPGKH